MQKDYGCFDGVYKLKGVEGNFIQRCVRGGRVCTNENRAWYKSSNNKLYSRSRDKKEDVVEEGRCSKLVDFDACSLYPSSMYQMKGYPLGRPKVIAKENRNKKYLDENVDAYYVCLLYTSPSPRDRQKSRMPSSA